MSATRVAENSRRACVVPGTSMANVLLEHLAQAKTSVKACFYLCTLDINGPPDGPARRTIDALVDTAGRNTSVEILIGIPSTPHLQLLNRIAARYMSNAGISVRVDRIHSKFIIIDNEFCIVGGQNLTNKALSENSEIAAAMWDADTARALSKTFTTLWERAQ